MLSRFSSISWSRRCLKTSTNLIWNHLVSPFMLSHVRMYSACFSGPFGGSGQIDSARQNLASTFVNGFVNAGFCADKLLTDDANKWFYKNKDHGIFLASLRLGSDISIVVSGMMSASASQGLLYRWDVDNGLNHIDKFLYVNEDYIKVRRSLLAARST